MSDYNGVIHGGGAVPQRTRRVFLASGKARTGYAMCYNWDATDVSAENQAVLSASAAMWCDARRLMVEEPTAVNNLAFAGVVDESSNGITGPNWIQIHTPGSICKIRTNGTTSIGASGTFGQGNIVTFTIGCGSTANAYTSTALGRTGAFQYTGLLGEGSAMMLAEGAASVPSDSYLKMARLMEGLPSGGVQVITSTATVSCLAAATDIVMITHGRVILSTATISAAAATLTCPPAVGQHFLGQTLIVGGPAALNTVILTLSSGSCVRANLSAVAGQPFYLASETSAVVTIETNYRTFVWDGVGQWWLDRCTAAVIS